MFVSFHFPARLNRFLFALFVLFLPISSVFGQYVLLYQKDGAAGGNQLGYSVARVGDVDGDGKSDFVVGAPYADPLGLNDAGSVFVYSGATGTLIYTKNGSAPGDNFGFSVGFIGGDTIIIGAPYADPNGSNSGSAYVVTGSSGTTIYQKNGNSAEDHFGYSVAGTGSVNGDLTNDFIIGAPLDNPYGAEEDGSAYVYSGATGGFLYQRNGYPGSGGTFGSSVAGAGDVNLDGYSDIIVGAPLDNLGLPGQFFGTAWVFSGQSGATLLEIQGANPGDFMGTSVGSAGDINLDLKSEVIVGAPGAKLPCPT